MRHPRRIYWWSTSADNRWGGLFYGTLFFLVLAITILAWLYLMFAPASCQ